MRASVSIEPEIRARISLYVAGLLASAMGLVALKAVLSGGEFTTFAFTLLTIGYCISWGVRARIISNSSLATISLVILLPTLAALIIEPQVRYQLIPAEVQEAPDLLAAILLASLMVAYSFKLTSDKSVLFVCVPALSLIGLLATADPTTEMLTYFGIYLACTCFALIRQNTLASREANIVSRNSIKHDLGITAGITLGALVIGSLIGTLLYPLIAGAFMEKISELDTTQMIGPAAEEFVPIATGPIALSDEEIMTVKCDRPLLWRERTYNKYTGRGWASALLPQEQGYIHPTTKRGQSKISTFLIVDRFQRRERSAVQVVKQTFHMTTGTFKPLFAAAEPDTVSFERWQPLLHISAGIEVPRLYNEGDTYHVVSRVSAATPRDLITASVIYPEIIKARYLGTPQSCWQVQKLTSRLTETATSPLQKAQAIESYLSTHYTYDLNAPAAPEDKDAVAYFLFQSKRGYCDIFASAMVIMSRQAGIPARWATGFAPGEYDSGDGAYHVRMNDKHAWAELYFSQYGWIPFDVTPIQEGSNWLARFKVSWRMLASDRASLFAGGLILFLIAYLLKAEVIDRVRLNGGKPSWQRTSGATEIGECYQRICQILARYGRPRYPAMTPLEYAAQTNRFIRLREISDTVDFLTDLFVEFRYSGREPAPENISAMKDNVQALARSLRKAKREKLLGRQ